MSQTMRLIKQIPVNYGYENELCELLRVDRYDVDALVLQNKSIYVFIKPDKSVIGVRLKVGDILNLYEDGNIIKCYKRPEVVGDKTYMVDTSYVIGKKAPQKVEIDYMQKLYEMGRYGFIGDDTYRAVIDM